MNIGFTFDGKHSSEMGIQTVTDIRRGILPPIESTQIAIPGRHGTYYADYRLAEYAIEIDIVLGADSVFELRDVVRQLADWLNPDRGVKQLIVDDEPELYYNAVLSGGTDLEQLCTTGQVTLTFLCPEPAALTVEEIQTSFVGGQATVEVGGTSKTWPRFQVEFGEPSTFLQIVKSENEFLLLGTPEDIETPQVPENRRIYTSNCDTLAGWEEGVQVDGGLIKGAITVGSPPKFQVSDYGTWVENEPSWHGPAMTKWLSEELDNFRVRVHLGQSPPGVTGRVEFYLLDINSAIIGKASLKDTRTSTHKNEPEARVGPATTGVWFHSTEHHALNDFYGVLELERIGTTWKFYIARRKPDGSYSHRRTTFYYDTEERFTQRLAGIQVHMAMQRNREPLIHYIRYITVSEINPPEAIAAEGQIPVLFNTGDIVEIDCATGLVLKNSEVFDGHVRGDLYLQALNPNSEFFSFEPGLHTLECSATGAHLAKVYHRERWL